MDPSLSSRQPDVPTDDSQGDREERERPREIRERGVEEVKRNPQHAIRGNRSQEEEYSLTKTLSGQGKEINEFLRHGVPLSVGRRDPGLVGFVKKQ